MIVEDQSEAIEFLSNPAVYGGAGPVTRVDTHGAIVFIAGDRVLKLKRAVRFDYMDFSTLDKRRAACEAVITVNQRAAPTIYRGIRAITRAAGGALALDGEGEVVDWLVDMARFDEETLFDRLAQRGALTDSLIGNLARTVADFHAAAETRGDRGGATVMTDVVEGNARELAACVSRGFDAAVIERVNGGARAAVRRHRALLDARRRAGFVRRCHGDLHLRNICLLEGRPTLFDAVEFNEDLACIDVLYDLAFLLMDLWHRQLAPFANLLFNRYAWAGGDVSGLALMPLFLACRAAIRSHVSAVSADSQAAAEAAARLRREARAYADGALAFLAPPAPRLIALGGLSGSGKSSLAGRLAPDIGACPGALVLSSDVVRKRMSGAGLDQRLGPKCYAPEVSARVYRALREQARHALQSGHAAIVDAVHARPEERAAIEQVAAAERVPFLGIWLEAPAELLAGRLADRREDVSDASGAVLELQRQYPLGEIGWRRVDAAGAPAAVLARMKRALACHAGA